MYIQVQKYSSLLCITTNTKLLKILAADIALVTSCYKIITIILFSLDYSK